MVAGTHSVVAQLVARTPCGVLCYSRKLRQMAKRLSQVCALFVSQGRPASHGSAPRKGEV